MAFNLNMHVTRLLKDEPFFAELSRKMDKRANTGIPTAGVRVNPDTGYFEMIYNPDFFEKLTDVQRAGVLVHEFYHCVFQHVTERRPDDVDAKEWNICADLAINDIIGANRLPEGCCIPGQGPFAEYPHGKTGEWYVNWRKQLRDENESDPQGGPGEPAEGEAGKGGEGEETRSNGSQQTVPVPRPSAASISRPSHAISSFVGSLSDI